ncbi:MAG: putative RNA uridine N3 methyltransferase [Candidatus Hodarchaeota archaeon]
MEKIIVMLPSSLIIDSPDLRSKTEKIGHIGRILSIYRIRKAMLYFTRESNHKKNARLISSLLKYMECPQYLRKRLFPLRSELKYAGVLPPLRTPHHPTDSKLELLKDGELREGVVVKSNRSFSLVDVGVEKPIMLKKTNLPAGKRITVRITRNEQIQADYAKSRSIREYWGYSVSITGQSLGKSLKKIPSDIVIATSRRGVRINNVAEALVNAWQESRRVLLLFGAPHQGLDEILGEEGIELQEVTDFNINTIPRQGTKTVRTEEALQSTLAVLDLLSDIF